MKKSAFLLLIMIGFLTLSSTKQEVVWLDKDLGKTIQSQAIYYKVSSSLEGEVTYYFKSKTMYRKVFYVNKRQGGKFNEYYESGELKEVGKYENGLREGNWKVYYRNGKIRQKGRYANGEKVGVWKIFYKND